MGDRPQRLRPEIDVRAASLSIPNEGADDERLRLRATISTETPCPAIDWERYEEVDEVLVARGCEAPDRVPLLDSHSRGSVADVLGSVLEITPADDVAATLEFDSEDERAVLAYGKARRRHVRDVSVGYRVLATTLVEPGQSVVLEGRTYTAGARRLRVAQRWALREVSLVPIGADPGAKVREQLEQIRAARVAAGGGAEMADENATSNADIETKPPIDLDAVRREAGDAARTAERERVRSIEALAQTDVPRETVRKAIDEGMTAEQAAALFLEGVRAKTSKPVGAEISTPEVHIRGNYERSPQQALRELGFGLRHQIGAPVKPIADVVRERANDHRRRSDDSVRAGSGPLPPTVFGISDRGRGIPGADPLTASDYERAAQEGYRYRALSAMDYVREAYEIATQKRAPRGDQAALDAFFGQTMRGDGIRAAGVSTADLANVFTDSVTAQLIQAYELAGDTSIFCREADIADFRSQERPRATSLNPMQKLPSSGAAAAGFNSLNDTVESYKAARYADQFAFDERAFIDDRLDLFQSIPMAMGRNAGQVRPDLVYYILLNGATAGLAAGAIFSTGNANYVASSGALAAATLQAAISAMRVQTESSPDGSSRILNTEPVYLVTAQGNRWTALELMNSTLIVVSGGTSQAIRGNANTLSGALQVVSDARFDKGVKDPSSGSSASADADGWALVAGQQHPTIEVGYVRATGRAPVIRAYTLERGSWGMGWDVKLDLGAKALDYRGLYYSKGA